LRELAALGAARAVGFGLPSAAASALTTTAQPTDSAIAASEPPPLAGAALAWIAARPPDEPWDRGLLSAPLYLRAPNIRRPPARGRGQR
jgi:hypothetical protein